MNRVIDDILIEATILGMMNEAMTYDEYLDNSPKITKKGKAGTEQGSDEVSIRTALAYKGKKFQNNQGQVDDSRKDAYAQAIAYLQNGIEQGELKRNNLEADVKDDVLRKSPERSAPADGTAKEPAENPAISGQPAIGSFDDSFGDAPDGPDGQKSDDEEIADGAPDQKNKELGSVNTEVFENTDTGVSDSQFRKNMNPPVSKSIKPPFTFDDDQAEIFFSKVPAVYRPVVERLLSQTIGKSSITDFMDDVGAGQPASQAGEIITMCALTMDDEASSEFFKILNDRVSQDNYPSGAWVDKSWIDSAQQVRDGTIARYNGAYGEGNWEIEKGCWDSAKEVEAMGLTDYGKNKGFSTDTYMRLKVKGDVLLDEISLKKDLNVNLLNKTTNALVDFAILGGDDADEYERLNKEYDELDTKDRTKGHGKALKQKIDAMRGSAFENLKEKNPDFAENIELANAERAMLSQRNSLGASIQNLNSDEARASAEAFEKNKDKPPLDGILRKLSGGGQGVDQIKAWAGDAAKLVASGKLEGITFDEDTDPLVVRDKDNNELSKEQKEEIFGSSNGKKIQKQIWYATVISSVNADGTTNKKIDNQRKRIENNVREHTNAVIQTINDVPSMREGMLRSIREEFPLKALFTGEEKMALAQFNCDPKVLKEIFDGAESYEDIEDKLQIGESPPGSGNLALLYSASDGSGFKPIAGLTARSEGMGYANTYKFELKVHGDFKNSIREGNREAYSGATKPDGSPLYESIKKTSYDHIQTSVRNGKSSLVLWSFLLIYNKKGFCYGTNK